MDLIIGGWIFLKIIFCSKIWDPAGSELELACDSVLIMECCFVWPCTQEWPITITITITGASERVWMSPDPLKMAPNPSIMHPCMFHADAGPIQCPKEEKRVNENREREREINDASWCSLFSCTNETRRIHACSSGSGSARLELDCIRLREFVNVYRQAGRQAGRSKRRWPTCRALL